jgi:hypothetical protein
LALAAATLASVAGLAACGGSSAGLIPPANAQAIGDAITELTTALANHECGQTRSALQNISSQISDLPSSVDRRLYDNLRQGYTQLAVEAPSQCKAPVTHSNSGTSGTTNHHKSSTGTSGATSSTGTSQGGTSAPTGPTGTSTTGSTGATEPTGPTNTTSAGGGVGPGGSTGSSGSSGSSGSTGTSGSTSGGVASD